MLVFGIDPGLQKTGLVCLVGDRILYRGNIETPSDWSDEKRRAIICRDVVTAVGQLPELSSGVVWVEGYEYQGPRTHTKNTIRLSQLIGQIVGSLCTLGHVVGTVDRTVWGRALGIKTDAGQLARLSRLSGPKLKNAHERDAACVALYGQRFGKQMEMVG